MFYPGSLGYPDSGSWASRQYQMGAPSCGMGFKLEQLLVGHIHKFCATVNLHIFSLKYNYITFHPPSSPSQLLSLHFLPSPPTLKLIASFSLIVICICVYLYTHIYKCKLFSLFWLCDYCHNADQSALDNHKGTTPWERLITLPVVIICCESSSPKNGTPQIPSSTLTGSCILSSSQVTLHLPRIIYNMCMC